MQVQPFEFRVFDLAAFHEETLAKPDLPDFSVEPEALPAPMFNEQKVEAIRAEAFAAGKARGLAEAQERIDLEQKEREEGLALLVADLQGKIADIWNAHQHEALEAKRQMVALALQLAQKMAGHAMKAYPAQALEPMLDECFAMLAGEARIRVRVAPDMAHALEGQLVLRAHEGQHVDIIKDDTMQMGDCRVEWAGGKAERDIATMWQQMEAVVERVFN